MGESAYVYGDQKPCCGADQCKLHDTVLEVPKFRRCCRPGKLDVGESQVAGNVHATSRDRRVVVAECFLRDLL